MFTYIFLCKGDPDFGSLPFVHIIGLIRMLDLLWGVVLLDITADRVVGGWLHLVRWCVAFRGDPSRDDRYILYRLESPSLGSADRCIPTVFNGLDC